MDLKNIIAVSGLPGLFTLVSSRSNGVIVSDMDTGKHRFVSVRKHQFTPLESIAIYTDSDTVELTTVFNSIKSKMHENPIVSHNATSDEIESYFEIILPDYDRDRVYIKDMKKILKWYTFLEQKGYLNDQSEEEE